MTTVQIPTVNEVTTYLKKKKPPDLVIIAEGTVPTTGFTNPHLALVIYLVPPKDGIQEFIFLADRPHGIVIPVLCKIIASTEIPDIDLHNYWGPGQPLCGVRVCGTGNCVEDTFIAEALEGEARDTVVV